MTNLKYDFINEDHKRMHNALISAGWTCDNDYLLNNNRHYSCDWFYSKDNFILFFNNDYQKVQTINLEKLDGLSFSEVADILETEMNYQQLLNRIGACIDRLVKMGFEDTTTESSLGRVFYIRKNQFSYRIVFYPTQIELVGGYKANSNYIEYTDNFEQELFDKLKELL